MAPSPDLGRDRLATPMSDTEQHGAVPPRKRTKVSRACDEVSVVLEGFMVFSGLGEVVAACGEWKRWLRGQRLCWGHLRGSRDPPNDFCDFPSPSTSGGCVLCCGAGVVTRDSSEHLSHATLDKMRIMTGGSSSKTCGNADSDIFWDSPEWAVLSSSQNDTTRSTTMLLLAYVCLYLHLFFPQN